MFSPFSAHPCLSKASLNAFRGTAETKAPAAPARAELLWTLQELPVEAPPGMLANMKSSPGENGAYILTLT